jgi:hypothetical protein
VTSGHWRYRCNGPDGGSHKVTDKLLAEGRGGFLQQNTIASMETGEEKWLGPLYSHAEADRVLERLLAHFMDQRRQQAMNQYYPYPYGPY